jgi:hypothetical protein
MEKIGLIAGNRRFPLLFAEAARKNGNSIVAIAIKGDTSPKLKSLVDKIHWLNLSEFTRMFEIFKAEGITRVAMAGQITPARLFSRQVQQSRELKDFLGSLRDKRADSIFAAVAQRLEESGMELLDSTVFIKEFLPSKGTLTQREPDFSEWEDVYFGFNLAKAVALLDIGQTVAVKNKAIVAVEALEGTDNLIRRAGQISRGRFTLVKVSKPGQDMRFDVPVVGLNTVVTLIKSGGCCLAIEAGKTLFIDQPASVKLADSKSIAIVAV